MHEYLDRRYALAFYEIAQQRGKTDEYLKDISDVVAIINKSDDFLEIIKHPSLSTSRKKNVFESIFKGKIEADILSFLLILIDKNRILELNGILEELRKIHLEKSGTVDAYIKTVVPLTNEERIALKDKLQKKYNRTIVLREEIDEAIIGGVYIRVGNDIIDGTIRLKFEEIRKKALKTE